MIGTPMLQVLRTPCGVCGHVHLKCQMCMRTLTHLQSHKNKRNGQALQLTGPRSDIEYDLLQILLD